MLAANNCLVISFALHKIAIVKAGFECSPCIVTVLAAATGSQAVANAF